MITQYGTQITYIITIVSHMDASSWNCLTVPHCRLSTYGCRAFNYAGPTVWNSLPDEFRNSDSFNSFKRFMKTILFSHY